MGQRMEEIQLYISSSLNSTFWNLEDEEGEGDDGGEERNKSREDFPHLRPQGDSLFLFHLSLADRIDLGKEVPRSQDSRFEPSRWALFNPTHPPIFFLDSPNDEDAPILRSMRL